MTHFERDVEIIYAGPLVQRAFLGIVYSGDWLHVIKEALNIHNVMKAY